MLSFNTIRAVATTGLATLFLPSPARAHVKWFSDYQSTPAPVDWQQLLNPQLLAIVAGFMAMMWIASMMRNAYPRLESLGFEWPIGRTGIRNRHLMLVAVIMTMVALGWKRNIILTPELQSHWQTVSLIQLGIISLSVIPKLRFILPLGLVSLFLLACAEHGTVHMVDYVFFLGIAWFIWCTRPGHELQGYRVGMTGLYRLTGFALCWVAVEKLVHPQWAEQVLIQQPILAMGFPKDFFIRGAALVEFTIGYLFIMHHWSRLSAVILSVVMVLTATLFGSKEIIGHLPLHAVLILFFADGPVKISEPKLASGQSLDNKAELAMRAGMELAFFTTSAVALTFVYYLVAFWKTLIPLA